MYEWGRKLIADIRARRGALMLTKHSDYMKTRCPDAIDLKRLEPVPQPVLSPSPSASLEQRVAALEADVRPAKQFLVDTFINYRP